VTACPFKHIFNNNNRRNIIMKDILENISGLDTSTLDSLSNQLEQEEEKKQQQQELDFGGLDDE
jgi:hypothetical protein